MQHGFKITLLLLLLTAKHHTKCSTKRSHLVGIQEFGVTAYVKDLKARKLNAHIKVG